MKKGLFCLVITYLLFFSSSTLAEASEKHVVIAISLFGNHNIRSFEGFKKGLADLGYVEGESVSYLFSGAYRDRSEVAPDLKKMVAKKPDLIYTATTLPTQAAKAASEKQQIPIIFGPINNPIDAGIVSDLKRPGKNITGVMLTDSTAKQIEWALRFSPKIKRILIPYNPTDASSNHSYVKAKEAVKLFGLELVPHQVKSQSDIDKLLSTFPKNIDLIFFPRDAMVMTRAEDFAAIANKRQIILTGTRLEMAQRGALFGFGFDGFELGRQAARLADQVLQGIPPGDLPVETAEDYLSINLNTAVNAGIKVPEHILRQAHIVIRPEQN